MLQFNHVTFQYEEEDFNIIDDLSFQVDQGDFISIIGISGCGKSTIFRLINKLLPMKSGEILILFLTEHILCIIIQSQTYEQMLI